MNQQPPEQPSYPQQQPYYPPQMQQESPPPPVQPKKRKAPIWVWITIGIILLAACGISNAIRTTPNGQTANSAVTTANSDTATSQPETPTPMPTPTPTPKPPVWTTTHMFNGNGAKKTETFTVGSDWKIQWKCNPANNVFGEYNIIIDVKNSDGSDLDLGAINTLCKAGNTNGETEERQGGSVYLDVNSEDAWTITVQELK